MDILALRKNQRAASEVSDQVYSLISFYYIVKLLSYGLPDSSGRLAQMTRTARTEYVPIISYK